MAGRICAARALNKLGIMNINVSSNSDRSQQWPDYIVGSITHSNEIAIAAHNITVLSLGIGFEKILSNANAY